MNALVTGGLGFIGSHLAEALRAREDNVTVYDACLRPGWRHTLPLLSGQGIEALNRDIRDRYSVEIAMRDIDIVYHLAAQVAVTASVVNPREDFEVNALGTLNVLEAARKSPKKPVVVFASTNKVYGRLEEYPVQEHEGRYRLLFCWDTHSDTAVPLRLGVPEAAHVAPCSPYGCSKTAADQYMLDYARTYGLRTASLRKSCIYGPRQFGCEDQGWVAWFVIAAVLGRPITIYGDGRQVRDLLHISDCVDAYLQTADLLSRSPEGTSITLNIGGGRENAWTLLQALRFIQTTLGRELSWTFSAARPGDQKVYISDISAAKAALGWAPIVGAQQGVTELIEWVAGNQKLLQEVLHA